MKGETASWNNVPQKAENTQTPDLRYLVMMATFKHTVTVRRKLLRPSAAGA
jgi:hypothetical protein